jgi:hypothetical protein
MQFEVTLFGFNNRARGTPKQDDDRQHHDDASN